MAIQERLDNVLSSAESGNDSDEYASLGSRELVEHHELVAESAFLDPLSLDSSLGRLPAMNNELNPVGAVSELLEHTPSPDETSAFSEAEAFAAIRDLGFIAATIRRYGLQPSEISPELEESLLLCGRVTGNVPRDTVFTYVSANPRGDRERRFTDIPEEAMFIEGCRSGMDSADRALQQLLQTADLELANPLFAQSMRSASNDFAEMVQAIVSVRESITPEVFTHELRPFFDPYTVGGKEYFGPGGAQMPILLIDQVVWGSDCKDAEYREYFDENRKYLPGHLKALLTKVGQRPSVAQRIRTALLEPGAKPETVVDSLTATQNFLSGLISFRMPHLSLAKSNFAIREKEDLGSGGYKPTILEHLVAQTFDLRQELGELAHSIGVAPGKGR